MLNSFYNPGGPNEVSTLYNHSFLFVQNAVVMFRGEPRNVQLAISNITETIIKMETHNSSGKMGSNTLSANAEEASNNAF